MKVFFDQSFLKSIDKLKESSVKSKVEQLIFSVEKANSLKEVVGLKKLTGYKKFYRFRIGTYRVGIELENSRTVRFIIVAHRKDTYKLFPSCFNLWDTQAYRYGLRIG